MNPNHVQESGSPEILIEIRSCEKEGSWMKVVFRSEEAQSHYRQAVHESLVIFGAVLDEKVVGFVSVRSSSEDLSPEIYHYFEIAYIYVEEGYRERKVAKRSIERASEYVVNYSEKLINDVGIHVVRGPCSAISPGGRKLCLQFKNNLIESRIGSYVDKSSFC